MPWALGASIHDVLPAKTRSASSLAIGKLGHGRHTIHYIYRSVIYAALSPSIAPMHPFPWAFAVLFNVTNGISIGGWLGGFGPTQDKDWFGSALRLELGMMIWALGFVANMWHDDELREIRRAAAAKIEGRQKEKGESEKKGGMGVDKVYMMPENGLFHIVLYPHYFTEWIEWCGFWVVGGWDCVPAAIFVMNEVATMLPRAIQGKQWYLKRFGAEKVGARNAVIPWLI
ncbi:uncharacterized protein KY384_006841 [Bacidia gigantensis]|uniref:uncharacterized protein n=1 Tax=Bacidia gigantensis TaxID=2732470 RepID=UPI001D0424C0|nr:uncharacterized protein KY384_006841 [Bacidia gigantensis]KAG8527925.1 hypothetical protein KY384_006841 [Bacidia gigantensis]